MDYVVRIQGETLKRVSTWARETALKMKNRLRGRTPKEKITDLLYGRLSEIAAMRFLDKYGWVTEDVAGEGDGADRGTDFVVYRPDSKWIKCRVQVKSTVGNLLLLPKKDYGDNLVYRFTKGEEPPDTFMLVRRLTDAGDYADFEILGGISAKTLKERGRMLPKGCFVNKESIAEIRLRDADEDEIRELVKSGELKARNDSEKPLSQATWACCAQDMFRDPNMYLRINL